MPGAEQQGLHYRFAGFELEPCERRLTAHGQPLTLTPKVFDTLVMLVERAGRVVGKDELMAALWPRGFVTDANLTKHIWAIRKALGGACEGDSHFIETVSKAGYRFVAPVQRIEATEAVITKDDGPSPAPAAEPLPVAGGGDSSAQPLPLLPDASNGAPVEQHVLGRRASDRELALKLTDAATARPRRRRWGIAVAVIAVLAIGSVVGGIIWQRTASSRRRLSPGAPGTTVAIVAFNDLSHNPKDAWLGPALTEMLATEVTATGKMHVLPGELVRPARKDLPVPMAGGYAPASLATLRKRLGADYVVSGGYLVSGTGTDAKVRVDVVLQDARNGTGIAQFSRAQPASGLLKLVADAGGALRAKLGLPATDTNQSRQVASAQPPSPDVARHIGFALDALDDYDPARARDELLLAVTEAPSYAPARMLLARAWMMLGYHTKAVAEIQRAAAFAQGLPYVQRSLIEVRGFESQRDWTKAAAAYRQLISQQPDVLEYRLGLAWDLSKTGQFDDAGRVLGEARKRPSPLASDPRIELMAWHVAYLHGDLKGEVVHARNALQAARVVDAPDMVANSEYFLGQTYGRSGKPDASRKLLLAANDYYRRSGDVEGQASVQRRMGWLAEWQNDLPAAREAYQRALAIYQTIGNRFWQSQVYLGLAHIQMQVNDADAALASARRALSLAREIGENDQQAHALAWVAHIESRDSPDDQALADFREAIRLYGQVQDKSTLPWALSHYGNALVTRGKLGAAQKVCGQMRSLTHVDDPRGQEYALLTCMCVEATAGDRATAMSDGNRLTTMAKANGDRLMYEIALLRGARLAINYADWKTAREQLTAISGLDRDDIGIQAMVQAWMALAANALGDARQRDSSAALARKLRLKMGTHADTFDVDLALTRLRGETGDAKSASADLAVLASDERHRDDIDAALKAELIRVQLLWRDGDPHAGKARAALAADARHQGFGWIVQRLATLPPSGRNNVTMH